MTPPPLDAPTAQPLASPSLTMARAPHPSAPLTAVCALTFLCSIGTGVVWAGVPFIAKEYYGFSQSTTLWLYVVLGATYVVGALSAARGLRRVERTLSPRGVLAAILLVSTMACAALMLTDAVWMLWASVIAINVVMSWLWPLVESYVTASRHGRDMRHALGVWNLTWTSAVVLSLIAMFPLVERHAKVSLEATGGLFLLGLLTLRWLPRAPGAHGEATDDDEHAVNRREYPQLLQASRMLLPVSYVLNSCMSPLLPFLLTDLGVPPRWRTPLTATWALSRLVTMLVLWKGHFWHGRWGALLMGAASLTIGFGMVVTAASLALVMIGLILVGVGMAVLYFATLYYAMTVGASQVDASGKFEALIGGGYTIGPLAGLLGGAFSETMAATPLGRDGGVIVLAWAIALLAGAAALRWYITARQNRRST
jgi:hypothetical protein